MSNPADNALNETEFKILYFIYENEDITYDKIIQHFQYLDEETLQKYINNLQELEYISSFRTSDDTSEYHCRIYIENNGKIVVKRKKKDDAEHEENERKWKISMSVAILSLCISILAMCLQFFYK